MMSIRCAAWLLMGSTGMALFGCGDPLPAPPRIAVNIDFAGCNVVGPFSLPTDPIVLSKLSPNIISGDLKALPRLVDGKDTAVVSCSVKETAPGTFQFNASADTNGGSIYFSITNGTAIVNPATGEGTGSASGVSFRVPQTDVRQGTNCTITTKISPEGGGALLGAFSCKPFHDPSVPNESCSATGTFALDRCDH